MPTLKTRAAMIKEHVGIEAEPRPHEAVEAYRLSCHKGLEPRCLQIGNKSKLALLRKALAMPSWYFKGDRGIKHKCRAQGNPSPE